MFDHVLVPLDGSDVAAKALDYAREIVKPGGRITLLTAIDLPEYAVANYSPVTVIPDERTRADMIDKLVPPARDYLSGVALPLENAGFTVAIETIIGEPAYEIVENARRLGVDAVVMSTHGRSGISRWLFGSVTSKVLGGASCPVFVVPVRKEKES